LTSSPVNLPLSAALNRLRGSLVGVDGKTSAVVAVLGPVGMANRHAVVGTIRKAAEHAGVPPAELRLGGPTVDSVALDTESLNARYSLAVISLVVSLLLAWWCLRQARLVAMVFAVALLSAGAAVALVYYTGNTMSLLLISMPTLVYVLAMSGAIHLTNYYREAMARSGRVGAAERALAAAWLPCVLSAGTTAVGLGSLSISQVVPVRLFGIYAAAGVLVSLPILFLLLPSLLELWPVRPVLASARHSDRRRRWLASPGMEAWRQRFVRMLVRKHAAVSLAFAAAMGIALVGLARLETSVKLIDMFSPRARIIQDYAWLERHLGPLVPVELVVRFDEAATLSVTERVRLIGAIQDRLDDDGQRGDGDGGRRDGPIRRLVPPRDGAGSLAPRRHRARLPALLDRNDSGDRDLRAWAARLRPQLIRAHRPLCMVDVRHAGDRASGRPRATAGIAGRTARPQLRTDTVAGVRRTVGARRVDLDGAGPRGGGGVNS